MVRGEGAPRVANRRVACESFFDNIGGFWLEQDKVHGQRREAEGETGGGGQMHFTVTLYQAAKRKGG